MENNRRSKLRIGAVSYLNTKPLVYGLSERLPNAHLLYDLPSCLADQLASGKLDVALIPTVEYFQHPDYQIVSDACIACRGPVLSVKLLSRVPVHQIRLLALDEGSRTSVALLRVLLWNRYGLSPEMVPLPMGQNPSTISADAVLVIGDRAIHADDSKFIESWDLGDEWCRWAEMPFVFAMWTARRDLDCRSIESAFAEARDSGVRNLEAIAHSQASAVRLAPEACLGYLRDNLHFYLGSRERKGLETFHRYAADLKIVPPDWTLEQLETRCDGCQAS